MSSIVPPLDFIPSLPGKGVDAIMQQFNKQTDKLLNDISITVKQSVKLPKNCKSDDPHVKQIKENLQSIQTQLQQLQSNLPKIQQSIKQVTQLINVAKSIKTAISVAQLSNPVTAPVFIAMQLTAIQDATIVNALNSLKILNTVPTTVASKLNTLIPPLLNVIDTVSTISGETESDFEIPTFNSNNNLDPNNLDPDNIDYNDLVPTEFYKDYNVSQFDLDYRSDVIEDLVRQQQDLLSSIIEAPSVVHRGIGSPNKSIGKTGDYYIDTVTETIYGPKFADKWI